MYIEFLCWFFAFSPATKYDLCFLLSSIVFLTVYSLHFISFSISLFLFSFRFLLSVSVSPTQYFHCTSLNEFVHLSFTKLAKSTMPFVMMKSWGFFLLLLLLLWLLFMPLAATYSLYYLRPEWNKEIRFSKYGSACVCKEMIAMKRFSQPCDTTKQNSNNKKRNRIKFEAKINQFLYLFCFIGFSIFSNFHRRILWITKTK